MPHIWVKYRVNNPGETEAHAAPEKKEPPEPAPGTTEYRYDVPGKPDEFYLLQSGVTDAEAGELPKKRGVKKVIRLDDA
jgi:hypothetical protein